MPWRPPTDRHAWRSYRRKAFAEHYFPHGWSPEIARRRRRIFLGFVFAFGIFGLLFLAGLTGAVWLVLRWLGASPGSPEASILTICGVPFIIFILISMSGGWVFRRFASPVAELMAAAEAISRGDLSVRVRERIPGEFGRLARSFNRMTGELQRAEEQRRNLTADIAHELRTPLHIIQGNLEGVLDGVYEPTPEHLSATLEETRLLARLVSDLQTLSLAEAGQLPMHPARFLAADLLSDVVTSFSGQAAELGIHLLVEPPVSPDAFEIYADPDRLDQVLSNLVGNALRYTPAGGQIRLCAAATPDGVRLEVADSGAGIPAEDLPYVFDRFWRGDRSRARSPGVGSGLGLAIARQLVHAMGGTISVESQVGQGTRFIIDLRDGSNL